MITIEFTKQIKAPKQKVWDQLWSDAGYRKWTSAFCEGSYAESNWQEGSGIRFLTPDGSGMYGVIQKKVPYEQMEFAHQGEIKKGLEEPKDWAGALERYYLEERDGKTELKVVLDTNEEFRGYLDAAFPKALEILKEISEQ